MPTNGSCLVLLFPRSSASLFFFFYHSCNLNTGLTGLLSWARISRLLCGCDWSKLTRWNNEWPLSRRVRESETRYLYTCHRVILCFPVFVSLPFWFSLILKIKGKLYRRILMKRFFNSVLQFLIYQCKIILTYSLCVLDIFDFLYFIVARVNNKAVRK